MIQKRCCEEIQQESLQSIQSLLQLAKGFYAPDTSLSLPGPRGPSQQVTLNEAAFLVRLGCEVMFSPGCEGFTLIPAEHSFLLTAIRTQPTKQLRNSQRPAIVGDVRWTHSAKVHTLDHSPYYKGSICGDTETTTTFKFDKTTQNKRYKHHTVLYWTLF